ncbi:MAG: helix-turn-helix domain-containing protein [Rhodobacteraceae bacterium]|nr:helix-turn-helix domain-containing protein [Paracoccaceae bacterium]
MSKQVGDDIRALRKSRGLTLKQMEKAIGRSAGWLSQIERGQVEPSIRDLSVIAEHFGLGISFFFRSASRDEKEQGIVLRSPDRTRIGSEDTGLAEELLSPCLSGAFEMIQSTFAPRSAYDGSIPAQDREDGGVLVSGQLTLVVEGEEFHLETGDSFQFSNREYTWRNDGDVAAVVVWVVSPPVY